MKNKEPSPREQLEIMEAGFYQYAFEVSIAVNPVVREENLTQCDILLDSWLDLAKDLGRISCGD